MACQQAVLVKYIIPPTRAGLSHMTKHGEEEVVVPTGALDFSAYGCWTGMGSKDVECEPAQDGEGLGSIVHSRPVAVLVEVDVEHPVQLVLDGPMTARDLQQPLGGHVLGQQGIAYGRRLGTIAMQLPARGDAADRNDAREAVDASQAGIAHDRRTARFSPVVSGGLDLFDGTALAGSCKLLDHDLEQRSTVGLDSQHVVAAAIEHRLGHRAMAMQRIGRDDTAFERQQRQYLQRPGSLVAARSLLLGKRHSRFHRPDVDHVKRFVARTALEGASQRLAVDRHHACEIEPVGLGKGGHEASECGFEGTRLEQTEHSAEGVVARNPVLQMQKQPQQPFLGLSKLRHIRAGLCSAQHRRQGDDQYLRQIVPRVGRPRIRQTSKNLLELPHPTPSALWEPFSESILQNYAIEAVNPYAIPLPRRGRDAKRRFHLKTLRFARTSTEICSRVGERSSVSQLDSLNQSNT